MNEALFASALTWQMVVLGALSLSIGWGIRGNFGHEYGAALPGALATLVLVLVSGRADWWTRIPYFALFGAIGWSFGGSMSYMQVVGYTHSGHPPSVGYGFANLFVIGFLWAFLGGAGAALPAFLSADQLRLFALPLLALALGWTLQSIVIDWKFASIPASRRHENPLYWYDTDWLAALVALVMAGVVALVRGGFDVATELMLSMSVGWFVAFLLLVNVLKLRMTPPRGDNWAGCVGMALGVLVFCWRHALPGVAFAALLTGLIGGVGFALGQFLKLIGIRSGRQTNWHSLMEQTQGFFHGLGLAVAMALLTVSAPVIRETSLPVWMNGLATGAVLLGLTYLNHRKATVTWVEQVASLPERFYGLPVSGWFRRSRGWIGWFEILYLMLGAAFALVFWHHQRHPLPWVPSSLVGQGMLFYSVLLGWCVMFNFERALVGFTPQRIVTEGLIAFNAIVAVVLLNLAPLSSVFPKGFPAYSLWIRQILSVGIPGVLLGIAIFWGGTHAIYGRRPIPHAGRHIRFGPDATAVKTRPKPGERHP